MRNLIIIFIVGLSALVYFLFHKEPIKNADQPISVIVAFGDSLTAGEGASAETSYPAVLARLTQKTVINEGYSGETAVNAPKHLPKVLAHKPQMVIIEFGSNDFLQRLNLDDSVASIAKIVDEVQAAGAVAVIVDTGGFGMKLYAKAYKKLAKKKQAVFVPGIMRDIFLKKEYMSDMVHPNFKGYKLVANKIYKDIRPYLN